MSAISLWQAKARSRIGKGIFFLSYRRADTAEITDRICDHLARRFGPARVLKDDTSIPLGVDYRDYISRVVPYSRALLVVIGPNWLESATAGERLLDDPNDMVRLELQSAFASRRRVIPLFVNGARVPPAEHLPQSLRTLPYRNGIKIRSDSDFGRDMERLIAGL
jgi:hypothetical protein